MKKSQIKLLIAGLVTVGLVGLLIFFGLDSWVNWLIFLSTTISIWSDVYGAEGYWISHVFDIISYIVYIPICFIASYYGEIISSILVIIISFVTLLKWKKNTEIKIVKIKKLGTIEIIILISTLIIVLISGGFIFRAIDTAYPFLNSLAITSTISGYYLAWRISRLQFLFGVLDNLCIIALWILAGINHGWEHSLFTVGAFISIFYMIYGYFNWGKLYRQQNIQSLSQSQDINT